MSRRRESLMEEPLIEEEIESRRKDKLDREKAVLLRDYDDSSDEDESLDYKSVPKSRVRDQVDELNVFKILKSGEIRNLRRRLQNEANPGLETKLNELEQEKSDLKDKLYAAREFLADNPSYVMEIEGRRAIYRHLSSYRQKKYETLGIVDLEIKGATAYNFMLVAALKNNGIITESQATKWKNDQNSIISLNYLFNPREAASFVSMLREHSKLNDASFFTEENKFRTLRKFLRQTNREVVDPNFKREISQFVYEFLGHQLDISDDQLKLITISFNAQIPSVRRPTLSRTRINSDIESVDDFYAEELLRYRSIIRKSREITGDSFDIAQTMVFNDAEDLSTQKKQTISRDKREDKSKDRFSHRGTFEEEVFNLGNYRGILEKFTTIGLDDSSIAVTIREIFKRGPKVAFDNLRLDGGQKLSELLTQESKQILVDTVELLFGTEGFRSPSSIVETNMMLDLIIADPQNWSFERAFIGKTVAGKKDGEVIENGGALSYTMKTMGSNKKTHEHSGGILCGRKLSHELDSILDEPSLRTHKYGGPFKAKDADFAEYKKRKEEVATSWAEKCTPDGRSSNLEKAIQRNSNKWYSR